MIKLILTFLVALGLSVMILAAIVYGYRPEDTFGRVGGYGLDILLIAVFVGIWRMFYWINFDKTF